MDIARDSIGGSAEIFRKKFNKTIQPNPTSRSPFSSTNSPFSSPSSPSLSVPCKMGQKRLTRAQVQQELDQELDKIRRLHSYAGNVQAQVEAVMGSTSIPPQQWRGQLENDERMGEYYKQVTEILKAQVAEEAEKCKALEEDYKSAKRAVFMMRDELEILKLKKTDPELNDSQRQVLSNIKKNLLEYPTMLGEVTGNETFMQAVKKSYELKLEEFEATLKKLIRDVFQLPMTCSNKVSTSLTHFAETTLMPAISIVKHQHEELETELGEANERLKVLQTELGQASERSLRLEKRTEQLEAEAENARVDIRSLTSEHNIRVQRLTNDIAALEKDLEATRDAYHTENQTHQHETTKSVAQLENARKTAAAQAKLFKDQIESYRGKVKELDKGKEALEETVEYWQEYVKLHQQEHDELDTKYKANQEQLKTAKGQVLSLEENLRTEKGAKETAEQERESLHNRVIDFKVAGRKVIDLNKSLTDELSRLKASSEKDIRSLQSQLSTEKAEKESLQQSHEFDIQAIRSQLSTAMTEIDSFKQSIARQSQKLHDERATVKAEMKSMKQEWEGRVQSLESDLDKAMDEVRSLRESGDHQAGLLRSEISTMKAERVSLGQEWEETIQSFRDQLSTAEDEKQSLERSFHCQLSAVKSQNESLKHLLEKEMQSFQSRLSTAESENISLMQAREKEVQSFQTQLLSSKSDNESLRQSTEKEMQSLRYQLSAANETNESLRAQCSTTDDTNDSLVKSKRELEARYCGATESLETKSWLLELHISILDNHDLVAEMEKLSGMTERYTGSTTEMVSMPKYMPGITLVGKAAELPEPNLGAARCLWMSSCCGSLALDITQAFFMQRKISSAQFALLPWIHASLSRAVTMISEKSTLTPDLAISSAWILQGLVYTATVAREWSSVWNPKIEGILAQMTHWLGEHVSDEASLLMVIVGQVNDIVTTHEPPSTSISPSVVSESRRIDSANSSIPDGMTIVVDTSGIFILFTADDAFIFGANEVKIIEVDLRGGILIKFEQAVKGLPATLMELRLLDLHSPVEVVNRHQALLKSVLTKDRIEYTNPYKRRRLR